MQGINYIVDLSLDLYQCDVHAQEKMEELGITYEQAIPQTISDSWWFFNCKNIPPNLPPCLSILNLDPEVRLRYRENNEKEVDIEVQQAIEDADKVITDNISPKAPEYTELERQRIKERWQALTPEQREKVMAYFKGERPISKPIKNEIPTLTYKQLAQNYNKEENKKSNGKKIKVETTIRRIVRAMNKDKVQIKIVNKPGTTITTKDGTFLISKKGKSIRIGD